MIQPSIQQLEKHIHSCAYDPVRVTFVLHARERMQQRGINEPMIWETLRKGVITRTPEPDPRRRGLRCVMERYVAGVQVGAVVLVDYPLPELTIITVMTVMRG